MPGHQPFENRLLIASLFLPSTTAATIHDVDSAVTFSDEQDPRLNEKLFPAPLHSPRDSPISPPAQSPLANAFPKTSRHASKPSIVDDLTAKSKAATNSPAPPAERKKNTIAGFSRERSEQSRTRPAPIATQPSIPNIRDSALEDDHIPSSLALKIPQPTHRRLSRKESKSGGFITKDTPISAWEVEINPSANGGLHNAILSANHLCKGGKRWIGVLGPSTDDLAPEVRNDISKKLLKDASSIPVWISDKDFAGGYDTFCHQVLWPSLHYTVPDAPKTKVTYESSSFAQYKAINERFAEKIVSVYKPGDIIWVNDYHLLLLPQLLRARLPQAIIGFFLHISFPSSEVFRCLAVRKELLKGMLGADLIGFQTHNYARHFRHTVSRILGVESLPKGIQLEHGFVDVGVFPIGIDVQSLTQKRQDPVVKQWVDSLTEKYPGMKLIVARDKLDEVQGVRQKFLGFERFLEQHPELVGKVMLIQVALSTTETNELQGNVADVISRINSKFSTLLYQPIIFFHTHDLTFPQYLALLTVADAFIVTSLREGMALRTHEFVECQEERKRPLILSEFTGTYSFSGFKSCIPINPWDTQQTADAIHQSLTMSDEEAAARWKDLHAHVNSQTAQAFVSNFVNRCIRVHYKHHIRDSLIIPDFEPERIKTRYDAAGRRLILIDLEKTLWAIETRPTKGQVFKVPPEAMELLKRLTNDERNVVWALSGLPIEGRLEDIAAEIPKIGICAEHGCFLKRPDSNDWISMINGFNLSWMDACVEILSYFAERTPGAFTEKRQATMVWRFWTGNSGDADDEAWARRQAAEAQNHIWDSLGERFQLRIIPQKNSFVILPKIVGRTTAVNAILNPSLIPERDGSCASAPSYLPTKPPGHEVLVVAEESEQFDYILAIGSDESLINRMKRLTNKETVYTGKRKSGADWRLEPAKVYEMLEKLLS